MKKFRIITVLVCCLICTKVFSQNIETSYANYFELPREQVFLHLNKTKFVTGETLWFKAYVTDQKYGVLNPLTKNLYVGIYDENGNELQKDLWYVEDGMTHGQIEFTEEFLTGEYYIKANTNYMKNFGPEQHFLQKISVINLAKGTTKLDKTSSSVNNAVISLLPEGGSFVLNTPNSIGVKLTDTVGYGYAGVRLSVKNQAGALIAETTTNSFGHARFNIQPLPGETYRVTAEDLADEVLPQSKVNGIAMRVNALLNQQVIVELNTNTSTINRVKDKPYQLLVHRDGLFFKIPVVFGEDELKKLVQIPRNLLFPGINILTLFNEQEQPILERMLFNDTEKVAGDEILQAEYLGKNLDSIAVALKYNTEEAWQLSASFLPVETDAYHPEHNIYSAFLLKPYLKGFIENAAYYFENPEDRKTKIDLDLLLLTQGWSSYDWPAIKRGTQALKYQFEQGLSLRGKVFVDENIRKLKKYEVMLFPTKHHGTFSFSPDENGAFTVENNRYDLGEKIEASVLDDKGSVIKPKMFLGIQSEMSPDIIPLTYSKRYNRKRILSIDDKANDLFYDGINAEDLGELIINAKQDEKIEDYSVSSNYLASTVQVDRTFADRFPNILDYIRFRGFIVDDFSEPGRVRILSRIRSTLNGSLAPSVFLDGARLSDFGILYSLSSENIESIIIDRTGASAGLLGANGIIRIQSRRTPLVSEVDNTYNKVSFSYTAKNGFEQPKRFFNPLYADYNAESFKKLGVLHWVPNIALDPEKSQKIINLYPTGVKESLIFLEGISTSGKLISKAVLLVNN